MSGIADANGPHNVLFLCTGNSARSCMAEAILNRIGAPLFRGYSAGSHPKGRIHPEAVRLLMRLGHDTSRLRSKSWDEFSGDCAVAFGTVITVCSKAARETCPVFPGRPQRLHWEISDPASTSGSEAKISQAFEDVYEMLSDHIKAFIGKELC
jgi:protein-tyrosine-phosphatase